MSGFSALVAVGFASITAARTYADTAGADRAAKDAQALAARSDFVGAAGKYREAFALDPRPDLMCNVGVAYYKAKDLPRSHRYLEQCLTIGTSLDRGFLDSVKKVLAAVQQRLETGDFTPVDLLVQPTTATTSVEGGAPFDEPIVGSRRVWFPFGSYRLTIHAAGHVDRIVELDAKERTARAISVALQRAPAETGPAEDPAQPPGEGSAALGSGSTSVIVTPPPPPPPPVASRRSIVPPLAATIATVAAGGVTLAFWLGAKGRAEDAGLTDDRGEYDRLVGEARDKQRMAWVFGGVAGAAAIASGVLWVRYTQAPRVEVQANGAGGAIVLTGRW